MEWLKYVLLFEDFIPDPIFESSDDKVQYLKDKQKKYKEKIDAAGRGSIEAGKKANSFKEKSSKTKDDVAKKIYQNRAEEEMITQKANLMRIQALQMAQKRNDIEIKTAELKKEKKAKKGGIQ